MSVFRFMVLLAATMILQACTGAEGNDDTDPLEEGDIEFSVLHSGDGMGIVFQDGLINKTIQIFTNQTEYELKAAQYGYTPEPVDFSENSVLLVDMGEQNTTGYSTRLVRVEQFSLEITDPGDKAFSIATVEYTVPGDDCITGDALTAPHVFAKVETVSRILIEEQIAAADCID